MKKIIGIILFVQSILITIVGIQLYKNVSYADLLYKDNTAILVRAEEESENLIRFFKDKGQNDNIVISKYAYIDDDNLIIYTNDFSLDGKVDLQDKTKGNTDTFVANYSSGDEKQIDQFHVFGAEQNITIRSMEQIRNAGIDGLYHVKDEYAAQIVEEINAGIGYAELYNDYSTEFISYFEECMEIVGGITMTILILIVTIIHYMIKRSKKIAILRIQGLSIGSVIKNIFGELFGTQFIVLILGITASIIWGAEKYGVSSIIDVFWIYLISFSFSNLFYFIIAAFVLANQVLWSKVIPMLKGKRPYKVIMSVHISLKAIFLVLLILGVVQLFNQMKVLRIERDNLQIWEKAENVYSIGLNYVGESREAEERLAEFYKILEEQGGFLIDAQNYELVDEENHLYDLNAPGEESLYDPYGRTIVVNENYLKGNPILINGKVERVADRIIYKDNTRNILVPEHLKKYEKEIYERFLKDFYFQKVEAENIYNEKLGKPLNNLLIEDLNINIIYVDQGQEYFPYANVEIENGCKIIDPIVVLETGNIDYSYYTSYLSRCMFFRYDGMDVYNSLIPIIKETKVFSEIQNATSVYDSHGQEIYRMEVKRNYLITVFCAIILLFFVSSYLVIAGYFQENKYLIYIKKVFGFNLKQRIYKFVLVIFLIDMIVLCAVSVNQNEKIAMVLGGLIIILDIIILFLESNCLDQKSFNAIIKGEH